LTVYRILVPLDGSPEGEQIIPDALALAGRSGEIVLLHVIRSQAFDHGTGGYSGQTAVKGSEKYLEHIAAPLREQGRKVQKLTYLSADASAAIDDAAKVYDVDMIACATHARGPLGRLLHGGVAWKAVANSNVPVVLRHPDEISRGERATQEEVTKVLVPLDGSTYAEKALPLASDLALQWEAALVLVHVVPPASNPAHRPASELHRERVYEEASSYLRNVALTLPGKVDTQAVFGHVVDSIVQTVESEQPSHVVMASHGRTGLSRVILGCVADELVGLVRCPIIVIPALAQERTERYQVAHGKSEKAAIEASCERGTIKSASIAADETDGDVRSLAGTPLGRIR
jgi:nucleotide-binding universal stress UspA family protein